ncbi:fimbria/pilus outer membrane usher protein [Paraburkholderia tropica]|uniref:fimbria/pilus outer membrane usher protein n=1 Tax=Paraburkholderia tropica TaxID=92647 RepID=UPI0007EC7111|nr:fimbria/pilus outer membrane usher protein [Paraburkholderia tropica]MBB2977540.1 outer membrane usher protein [Paraburkholderia tropica]OBR55077.1 fimbrial assembly protein [Paraburkholderia tropica]
MNDNTHNQPVTAFRGDGYRLTPLAAAVFALASSSAFADVTPGGDELAVAAAAATNPSAPAAANVEFNEQFLSGAGARNLDISRFNAGNAAAAGEYRAAVYVNQVWVGVNDVSLAEIDGHKDNIQPVVDRDLLERMGVDPRRLSDAARTRIEAAGSGGIATLPELIPGAAATFDMGEQRLDVSLPQAVLNRSARGWVDPAYWDDGINSAMLQYNANVFHTNGIGPASTQSYLGLTGGINAGPWRFRYNGNVTSTTGQGTHVQSLQTYLQRSIVPLKSELTLGDSYTDGSIFDSFGVRGVQLATDDRMYPESQRGYAPTVRGFANSNARVQVRQNGNIIYETTVAPGPFQIDDLYATGYGGDLQLVITEADGSQRVSAVPYSAPVNALREGRWRYSAAMGLYRASFSEHAPFVFEANVQHGLNNLVTLYGGLIASEKYLSGAAGVALNTPLGAFGFDVTEAATQFRTLPSRSGQSLRLSYSRIIAPTNTNITLAAYRYSTSGFLSLPDAVNLHDLDARGLAFSASGLQKGRVQVTLNQSLGSLGSFYLSGYTQNYWNRSGRDTSYQFGYNTLLRRVGIGVSASRDLDVSNRRWDNRLMLNVTVPLNLGSSIGTSNTAFVHDTRDGSDQLQESFSGAFGKNYEVNYGVTAAHTFGGPTGSNSSISANGGYLGPYTQLRANASHANGYTQVGAGMSGSLVAWPDDGHGRGGVAVTSQTGDTFAVIDAKDAAGARIASAPGVRVDPFGHAVVAGMNPYEQNTVEIDPKGLSLGVELKNTEQHFAPSAGAVVRLNFETVNRGKPLLLRVKHSGGDVIPLGAQVFDAGGNNVGSVAQGGRVLVYSKAQAGEFAVKWGDGAQQTCKVSYYAAREKPEKAGAYEPVDAECR